MGVQLLVQEIYLGPTNHPDQLSLAIPPWVGAMSTGQRALMLCGWGVMADMVRVRWQVKHCEHLYNMFIPEHFRGFVVATKSHINLRLHYFPPGLQSPFQPKNAKVLRPVPRYSIQLAQDCYAALLWCELNLRPIDRYATVPPSTDKRVKINDLRNGTGI